VTGGSGDGDGDDSTVFIIIGVVVGLAAVGIIGLALYIKVFRKSDNSIERAGTGAYKPQKDFA
tara:strand:- start:649 stop:837 length:189 start_codon:yes stop_codon:yes gene_type:complete